MSGGKKYLTTSFILSVYKINTDDWLITPSDPVVDPGDGCDRAFVADQVIEAGEGMVHELRLLPLECYNNYKLIVEPATFYQDVELFVGLITFYTDTTLLARGKYFFNVYLSKFSNGELIKIDTMILTVTSSIPYYDDNGEWIYPGIEDENFSI